MKDNPKELDGAKVLYYSRIDYRHRLTGNCKHEVAGELMSVASGLAICQYNNEDSFYLFYCDEDWNVVTDTWHQTLEDAMNQAEFEYEGVSVTWHEAT